MKIYTPVVRAAKNDLQAVELLGDRAKNFIMPLIEAPRSMSDGLLRTDVAKATAILTGKIKGIPYYFDPLGIENFSRHLAAFSHLAEASESFTPTIGLGRGAIDYESLAELIKLHTLNIAIRLEIADLDDASEDTWSEIISITGLVGAKPSQVTLLIDLGQLGGVAVEDATDLVLDFLALQPKSLSKVKIVTLGSTALTTVASVPLDGRVDVLRRELQLWGNLRYELEGSRRPIGFGDYGVIDPSFIFPGGPAPNANAKIRYTQGGNTTYFRGHGLYNPNRFPQFHDLAKRVIDSGIYMGAKYSYGDRIIEDCAERRCGPGNAGTWVKVGMNHHMEYAANQINKLNDLLGEASNLNEVRAIIERT